MEAGEVLQNWVSIYGLEMRVEAVAVAKGGMHRPLYVETDGRQSTRWLLRWDCYSIS